MDVDDPYVEGVTPVLERLTEADVPDTDTLDISPVRAANIGSSPVIPKRTCPVVPGVVEVMAPIPEPISTP